MCQALKKEQHMDEMFAIRQVAFIAVTMDKMISCFNLQSHTYNHEIADRYFCVLIVRRYCIRSSTYLQ